MAELTKQRVRRWWVVPFFVGASVLLVVAQLRGWPPSITGRDIHQHRANAPAAIPNGDVTIAQTFAPTRDGLHEIELIVYQTQTGETGEITLELLDQQGSLVASQTLASADLAHNETLNFKFAVQGNSADSQYTLRVTGRDNLYTTFWGFDLESVSSGQLTVSDPAFATTAQDLRIVTYYQLTGFVAINWMGTLLRANILPAVMLLWVVGICGWLTLYGVGKRTWTGDFPTDMAIIFAVGLSVVPLLWLWLTAIGGSWGRVSLWLALLLTTLYAIVRIWRDSANMRLVGAMQAQYASDDRIAWQHIILGVLLVVGYFLRLLAIRDLAFPAWVDASRHGLMTAVMRDSGQFLQNYGDYLPIEHIPLYHFGYHALSATLAILTELELPHLLLTTGQLLNAFVPLAVYAAAFMLTRERTAGLCAAFMVALPSFFPTYYASWGRYTQLTGVIVLAVLVGWSWWVMGRESAENPTNQQPIRRLFIVSLLASGLFLIHFRLFLIYLPFGLLVWLVCLRRESWWQLPLAGVMTWGLILPRFWQMARYVSPERVSGSSDGYNDFPIAYAKIGWERWFLIAALLIVIVAALHLTQRVRWRNGLMIAGLLVFVLVGEWLGSIPALLEFSYLRTAAVGLLLLLSVWRSLVNWIALPIAWLIFEPFFLASDEKIILAVLLLLAVWMIQTRIANGSARIPLLLALWAGLLFLLLSGARLGLPESWVLNMNSTYITMFLPLVIVLGWGLFVIGARAAQSHWLVQMSVYCALGAAMMLLTLYGGRQQIEIISQSTVLAERPDEAGIAWVAANLPEDARIAVSSWKWLGHSWAAQDGGAWLLPVTGRMPTTPPADYIYQPELERTVRAFNEAARDVNDWSAESALDLLRQSDVTHLYVGSRGGFLLPDKLMQHEEIELLFARDGVFIFALLPADVQ